MTEEKSKLRDEFAKIAFKEILSATLEKQSLYSIAIERAGKDAYEAADNAMEARDAK